ncbi:MAG: sigma-70 family RNA polymerase sigma factor [Ktedonobacteraceae bacterium]|nr:sigma-70 family RNA polymerase sigma factor [Ktedonobacteraceae bacterium]
MNDYPLQSPQSLSLSLPDATSTCTAQNDVELVAASVAGDQDAFAQLVQRHQRRVFNLVFRMVQKYEEADEITQETFLAAWQGLPSFRGDARFSTWLYRIAYNCSLKQLEQSKRDKALQAAIQSRIELDKQVQAEAHDCQTLVR